MSYLSKFISSDADDKWDLGDSEGRKDVQMTLQPRHTLDEDLKGAYDSLFHCYFNYV